MSNKFRNLIVLTLGVVFLFSCTGKQEKAADQQLADSTKIVSLNGAVSEIIAGIGLEKNIVGTDVTSNYPESLKKKAKIGHNRNINAEGVLALKPNLVIGIKKEVSPALVEQFKAAGIKLILLDQEFSIAGAKNLIHAVADSLKQTSRGDSLVKILDADLAQVKQADSAVKKPKVLFIYARGTGTMMVGGTGTQVEQAIILAGGQNAVTDFADYKPLTAEALVQANPDVILLFSSGLQSLGGPAGLMSVQGIKQTNAGRNNKIIEMDGELLSSFGPRLGKAIQELAQKIK
ncbi:heme/hemin ABC transporter substrate-binding protein [Pedobacter duraquae]|uniref:Iron complex transport system substrate-binding protein n=1 Tax=Pedobacter duraquae TaxID=425511 RepID=A0A4R6IMR0_9SPHI|nr:ABC transporter substrate-binding protein [Pedobacter duraquae]TDO23245.1 iron complex transport system substrate-binding protein [Pedobacter duraquae]